MFPWLWVFAPATHWPLSGAVEQALTPEAFFGGIRPGAGDPEVEQRAFQLASYGKQLGWLTDVLVAAIEPSALPSEEAREALESLKRLKGRIARIKAEHRLDQTAAAVALLDRIAADDPEELRRLLQRYLEARNPRAPAEEAP
jgi:hypothetical protein